MLHDLRADGKKGASFYVAAAGDWTCTLFARSLLKQHRQLWVTACNPSTTDHSIKVVVFVMC
jgi:hypothetical protein